MYVLRQSQKTKAPDLPQDGRSPTEPVHITLNHGLFALVDADLYSTLNQYKWKAVKSNHCWYAVRRAKKNEKGYYIRMHRQVAQTPTDMDCHHIDLNSLNNTRRNLSNLFPETHRLLHCYHHYTL